MNSQATANFFPILYNEQTLLFPSKLLHHVLLLDLHQQTSLSALTSDIVPQYDYII